MAGAPPPQDILLLGSFGVTTLPRVPRPTRYFWRHTSSKFAAPKTDIVLLPVGSTNK